MSKAQRRASISTEGLRRPGSKKGGSKSASASSSVATTVAARRTSLPDEHEKPSHLVSFGIRARRVLLGNRLKPPA